MVIQSGKLEINTFILYKVKIGNSAKTVKNRFPLMHVNVNVNVNIKIVLTYMLWFNWCHLYLLDRKQVILLDCESCVARQARIEVPRGSILGPLFLYSSVI